MCSSRSNTTITRLHLSFVSIVTLRTIRLIRRSHVSFASTVTFDLLYYKHVDGCLLRRRLHYIYYFDGYTYLLCRRLHFTKYVDTSTIYIISTVTLIYCVDGRRIYGYTFIYFTYVDGYTLSTTAYLLDRVPSDALRPTLHLPSTTRARQPWGLPLRDRPPQCPAYYQINRSIHNATRAQRLRVEMGSNLRQLEVRNGVYLHQLEVRRAGRQTPCTFGVAFRRGSP